MISIEALLADTIVGSFVEERVDGAGHTISVGNEIVVGADCALAVIETKASNANARSERSVIDRVLSTNVDTSFGLITPNGTIGAARAISAIVVETTLTFAGSIGLTIAA